jgi:hypothetical protein
MNLLDINKYLSDLHNTTFTEDYYENGIQKHISGYENYSWMPTRSYPEAIDICKQFPNGDIIDYGCAKGFLVHSLRQLGRSAYGEDLSEYALNNCMPSVKVFLSKPSLSKADIIICKDIAEHVPESTIPVFLQFIKHKCKKEVFFVVPLGDNNMFRIREYEIDITHVTKKDEDWWINSFREAGFRLKNFSYSLGAIKEKWTSVYPYGNGFFVLEANHGL